MIKKKYALLSFLLWGIVLSVNAQDTTYTVQFAIIPQGVSIRIDGKDLPLNQARLATGKYMLEVWHPLYEYWVDTLTVENESMIYRKRLNILPAYDDYRTEFNAWNKEKKKLTRGGRVMAIMGIGLMGASSAAIIPEYFSARSSRSDMIDINEQIASSITTDQTLIFIGQYNDAKSDFESSRNLVRGLGFGVFVPGALFLVGSQFVIKSQKKKLSAKPIFEPNEPFTYQEFNRPELKFESTGFSTSLKLNF